MKISEWAASKICGVCAHTLMWVGEWTKTYLLLPLTLRWAKYRCTIYQLNAGTVASVVGIGEYARWISKVSVCVCVCDFQSRAMAVALAFFPSLSPWKVFLVVLVVLIMNSH